MKTRQHIAIDLGASNGRIMIGTRRQNAIHLREAARFSNDNELSDGVLCWNYAALMDNLSDGLKAACAELDGAPESISCDSWAQDFALLDGDGKVFSRLVSYREPRAMEMPRHIAAMVPANELQISLGQEQASSISTLSQLKFMAENERQLLNRATTLLHIADLVHYELCGNPVSNWALAAMSQLMNIRTQTWDLELLDKLAIPTHFLGKIASGKIIGQVSGSRFPEILRGVPVVSGVGHDTAAAFLAVDLKPGACFLSLGTWAMLGYPHDIGSPLPENFHPLGIYPGRWAAFCGRPGMWLQQQCVQRWEEEGIFPGYEVYDAHVEASSCEGIFDPAAAELFSPNNMPAQIRNLCERNHSEIPLSPGDFGKVINRSLAECYYQAAIRHGREPSELLVTGGGSDNVPLMKELAARFTLCKGPREATAIGNLKAQIEALA
jgi:rhamnulokinase